MDRMGESYYILLSLSLFEQYIKKGQIVLNMVLSHFQVYPLFLFQCSFCRSGKMDFDNSIGLVWFQIECKIDKQCNCSLSIVKCFLCKITEVSAKKLKTFVSPQTVFSKC